MPDVKRYMEEQLAEAVPDERGPGGILGLVADGGLSAVAMRGRANLEHEVPITAQTCFHVASVSKQFTAYSVALLEDEGRLRWHDPVQAHLPWFPFPDITVEHLVHHTSGLRDQWSVARFAGWRSEDVITTEDVLRRVADQRELNFPPGTNHAYSNTGYTLLAEIVRHLTGTAIGEFCRERIFEPLGMTSTVFVDDRRKVIAGRADSYMPTDGGGFQRVPMGLSVPGATGLSTTIEDLARWSCHAMSPPVTAMLQRRTRLWDGEVLDYALGVILEDHDGEIAQSHSGGDAAFHAYIFMVPSRGVAGLAMSNHQAFSPGATVRRLVGVALGSAPAPVSARPKRVEPTAVPVAVLGQRSSGWYVDGAGTACHLTLEEDEARLRLAHFDMPLDETAEGTFVDQYGYGFSVRRESEDVICVRQGAKRLERRFTRVPPPDPGAPLGDYHGSFYSPELDVLVHIRPGGTSLVLRHPVWGDVELDHVATDLFVGQPPSYPQAFEVTVRYAPDRDRLVLGNPRNGRFVLSRVELPPAPDPVSATPAWPGPR